MHENTPNALNELLDIEEFLRERLESLEEAGGEARTPFVNALREVQALLSLGLKGIARLPRAAQDVDHNERAVRTGITRKQPRRPDAASGSPLAAGEFVLEYNREIAALARERTERPRTSPAPLRLKSPPER